MSEQTTILVPIRYPLTDQSSQTLAAAGRIAEEQTPADIRVLHVNLLQFNEDIQTTELTQAISSVLDGVDASVTTRRGFLVENVILEEAAAIDADTIVVGVNQNSRWRRALRRLLGDGPAIGAFLRDNSPGRTDVVEVDPDADVPRLDAVT